MPLFALNKIKANPFRDIDQYPIKPEKIAALKESIEKTGFWDNIVARTCKGGAEIAYGHHRLTALREVYKNPNHKVELIIKELTNETMIQIMAHENVTEWGHNVAVEHETIRAVVQAFGKGEIRLPAVPKDTPDKHIRIAPSYAPVDSKRDTDGRSGTVPEGAYTAKSLAEFIGWTESNHEPQDKVIDALNALEFIEAGLLKTSDFESLSKLQVRAVLQETRRTLEKRAEEAKIYREQAEKAAKAAVEAEKQRMKAKTDKQREEAETKLKTAVVVQRYARVQETKIIEERKHKAKEVGKTVASRIKSGDIGYKRAGDVTFEIEHGSKQTILLEKPDIHTFEKHLARDINRIFDFDDPLVARLNELLKFKTDLIDPTELVKTLETVAGRFQSYADKLRNKNKKQPETSAVIESRIN